MRAILYARISISRDESVSVERQFQAGRDYCKSRGWEVVAEYVDDGVSASQNKPEDRVGWKKVLNHPDDFDVALVWKVDRLARRVLDFLHADEALQARSVALVAVEDPIDMTSGTGRAFATLLAVFGEMEAEAIRARVKDAKRALIKAGRVSGGAAPYGYWNAPNPDGPGKVLMKDSERISYVVDAVNRIMRGESVYSVVKWLNETGAPVKGRKNEGGWSITVVRRLLMNPVLAGMTPYNPGNSGKVRGSEVLRGQDGLPIIRDDLAIMTTDERRHLLTLLADKSRPRAINGATSALLSGLVWCTKCDRKMYRNVKTAGGKRVPFYRCEGCQSTARRLDDHVIAALLADYGHEPVIVSKDISPVEDRARLADIEAAINEAAVRMKDDDADMDMLAERLATLKGERQRAREGGDVQREFRVTGERLRTAWAAADGDHTAQRRLLTGRVTRVRVRPAGGRTGRNFDPTRVELVRRELSAWEREAIKRLFWKDGAWKPKTGRDSD